MKMESQIPFSDGMGKQKMKLEVRIPFSHIVGKRLALRYKHSVTIVTCLWFNYGYRNQVIPLLALFISFTENAH